MISNERLKVATNKEIGRELKAHFLYLNLLGESETKRDNYLKNNPTLAKAKDWMGNFTIHDVLRYGTVTCDKQEKVINRLVKLYPQCVQRMNDVGQYPLHVACQNNHTDKIVSKLIDLYPDACKKRDVFDCDPAEYALRNNYPPAIMNKLALAPSGALSSAAAVAPSKKRKRNK